MKHLREILVKRDIGMVIAKKLFAVPDINHKQTEDLYTAASMDPHMTHEVNFKLPNGTGIHKAHKDFIEGKSTVSPAHHILDALSKGAPSLDHLPQIAKWYSQRDIRHEDLGSAGRHRERPNWDTVYGTLKAFSDIKNKDHFPSIPNPNNPNDPKANMKGTSLKTYANKTFPEFREYVHKQLGLTKAESHFSHPDAPLVYNQNGYKAHELQSKEAATHLNDCTGGKLCTGWRGEDNMFASTREQGKIFHIETPEGKHYQFHSASDQFSDMQNKMHTPEQLTAQHPEMKNFDFIKDHRFSNKPIKELIKDRDYHASIAKHGTDNHIKELLKRPDLNPNSHPAIARYGTNDHRTELLKRPDLNPDSYPAIAIYGTNDHRTELLKKPDLRPDARKYIKDNHPHLINTRN